MDMSQSCANDCQNVKYKCFTPYKSKGLVPVGFSCLQTEPNDEEVCDLVDQAIYQVLGPRGLAEIIKPGYKVVLKVNLVGTGVGSHGNKNRGGITDPRIVRHVAEKVREIIGFEGTADLKVVDATFYKDKNPSLKETDMGVSFYWARLDRNDDDAVDDHDICYDSNADGFLDGGSRAKLVNLDSLLEAERQVTKVQTAFNEEITVCLPKFLRTREEAEAEGSDDYCDVLIGIPVLKSHGYTGMTGAIKLHYGFRHYEDMCGDSGRYGHSGLTQDASGIHHKENLLDYICAEHIVRGYDFVIMDCLTGNREGPMGPNCGLVFNSHKNEAIDYILTNAVMASRNSVAIDTVETVLGGYDPNSIELLKYAHENGLGPNDPRMIQVEGFTNFYQQRQYLYNTFAPDQYPFEEGWGGAQTLSNTPFQAQITIQEPEMLNIGTYAISYSIAGPYGGTLDLSRAELWINQKFIAYKNKGNIYEGKFVFNLNKEHLPRNSYLDFIIAAWDSLFNCIQSSEIVYKFE